MFKPLALIAPLLLLSACATSGADLARFEDPGGSAYGLFLAGQGALNDGRSAQAMDYFNQAQARGEPEGLMAERTFIAAILAGDITRAAALAPTGDQGTEPSRRIGRLVKVRHLA